MNYIESNSGEFRLMVWEESPTKRNVNNVIKVNVKKTVSLEIGDTLNIKKPENYSTYTVVEIIEKRQSSLSDYNYYTLKTTWSTTPLTSL